MPASGNARANPHFDAVACREHAGQFVPGIDARATHERGKVPNASKRRIGRRLLQQQTPGPLKPGHVDLDSLGRL